MTLRTVACFCPWGSPGMNTGVGSRFFLQIFPIQGSNLGLLQADSLLPGPAGKPVKILALLLFRSSGMLLNG